MGVFGEVFFGGGGVLPAAAAWQHGVESELAARHAARLLPSQHALTAGSPRQCACLCAQVGDKINYIKVVKGADNFKPGKSAGGSSGGGGEASSSMAEVAELQ